MNRKNLIVFTVIAAVYYLIAFVSFRLNPVQWVAGYFLIALFIGHLAAGLVYMFADNKEQDWSSCLTGFIERSFFCLAVANQVGGAAVSMIAWMTLKNLSYLGKFFSAQATTAATPVTKSLNLTLLASMVSLLFSMLGGLYCTSDAIRDALQPTVNALLFLW